MAEVVSAPVSLPGLLKKFNPSPGTLQDTSSSHTDPIQTGGSGSEAPATENTAEQHPQSQDYNPAKEGPAGIVDGSGEVKDSEGRVIGRVVGDVAGLVGKLVNTAGQVLDNGQVVGTAEPIDTGSAEGQSSGTTGDDAKVDLEDDSKVTAEDNIENAREGSSEKVVEGEPQELAERSIEGALFADFPDSTVDKDGWVIFEGEKVGRIIEGDVKKLFHKKVGPDGEICDDWGRVLGRAERWEEEEVPEPEPEKIDLSALGGKRVNKAGNIVDANGIIYGRLVEGDPKKLAGRMCDKEGFVRSEDGNIVGRGELIPESEREGQREGPFSGFEGLTIGKEGKVVDTSGAVVGRLTEGDAKRLYGRAVDEDGDVLDKNGNVIARAERWEEEEKESSPLAGLIVNRQGEVRDRSGDLVGRLTEGAAANCAGKEIDRDGDVVNSKGEKVGHATLIEIESEEDKQKREQAEQDRKLAGRMATCIQQSIDKIQPILTMITDAIDEAERQPKEELDEEKVVATVRPLIEEGGKVLQEANGIIRGLDPDGRIAATAKQKTAAHEATPEEYHLAELLKELTGNVTQTIENAKKKIAGMPHVKKELNPLWGLLAEPLGQILAAVGLLLSGVLGLVGRLLGGLGLGGLLDHLLGGLGIKGVLEGLGLGTLTDSLTGKKKS